MLIDSHCHLHDREFFTEEQAYQMLQRAKYNGIEKIICIGTDPEDSFAAHDFAVQNPDVYWTFGVHPNDWEKWQHYPLRQTKIDFKTLKNIQQQPVAVGEIGLDYHYGEEDKKQQIKLLNEMLQIASDNNLPISFHIREAFDDFFGVIQNFPKIEGVVHSFSDNKKNLKRILNETNFYIGINGMATYSTLPTPPIEKIVLETDAPFLTPVPFRGIINEPGYVKQIASWLSNKLELDPKIIEQETTKNAERLFRISDSILR